MDSWGSSQRWWSPQPPRALHIKFKSSQVKSSQVKSSQVKPAFQYCTVLYCTHTSPVNLESRLCLCLCLLSAPDPASHKRKVVEGHSIDYYCSAGPHTAQHCTGTSTGTAQHSTAQHSTAAPTTKHQAPANTSINPSSSQTRRRLVSSRCFALPSSTLPPSALLTPPFPRGPRCLGGRVEAQQASTAPCGRTRRRRPTRCPRCPRSPLGAPRRPPPPPTA